jgi:hypothetical protein
MPQSYIVNPSDPPLLPVFHFVDVSDAELSTEIVSAIATVSGITTPQPIKIAAQSHPATYSVNGGAFTSQEGLVSNGDQIRIKITSDSQYLTTRFVTINIGGEEDMFTVTTKKQPPVSANLALNKPVTASSSQAGNEIMRINDGSTTTRWAGATNVYPQSFVVDLLMPYKVDKADILPYGGRDYRFLMEGSMNGIDYFTLSNQTQNTLGGTIIPISFEPKIVQFVRLTFNGAATYTGNWTSINEFRLFEAPADTIPDQFTIPDIIDADLFSLVVSEPFTVTGIDGKTSIYLTDATEVAAYSVNNGLFTNEPSFVENNDVVRIQLGTGSQYNTTYTVKVNIGGISENFSITTKQLFSELNGQHYKNTLVVYPNPSKGIVNIQTNTSEEITIEIYNISGTLLKKEILPTNVAQLNLSDLKQGFYMLKCITKSEVFCRQLILETNN